MFSFLGKNDYTSKCTKILNKETGLDPLIAQAFIEDFKPIFDEISIIDFGSRFKFIFLASMLIHL